MEKPLTSRQQQAKATRQKIIDTALELFARQGFDGTATRQIAREAGITEGLIFYYFPTKTDLLNAILKHQSFVGEIRSLLNNVEEQPVTEVLRKLADGWLRTLRRETAITLVLFSTAQTNAKVDLVLRRLINEGVSQLAEFFAARIQANELRNDLPTKSSAMIYFSSLIIFFTTHHRLSEQEWEQESAIFTQELILVLVDGLHSK